MNKIFSIDGGFFRFMTRIADIIIINLLLLVCSIPIITIGPALVAAHYVTLKAVRDEESGILRDFFKSFKQNLLQGIIAEILSVVIVAFFAFDVYTVYNWMNSDGGMIPKAIFGLIAGLAAVVALGIIYLFPMIAKFYNSTFNMLKNSIAMAIHNLPYSLLMALCYGAAAFLIYINPFSAMFVFGAVIYINSFMLVKIFDRYIPKKEEDGEEEATEGDEEVSEESVHITLTENDMKGNSETDEIHN